MSSFKRIKNSDVFVLPYVANKQYDFSFCSLKSNNIAVYNGKKHTGSFDSTNDYITNGKYDRLVFDVINNTYYQQFSGSFIDTGSLVSSNYYEGDSKYRPSSSYYEYSKSIIKNFPTSSNAEIKVISIPPDIISNKITPGTFRISGSQYTIIDDQNYNLVDISSSYVYVGNIFYEEGIAVITNQDYQNYFPIPPFLKNDYYRFYQEVSPKTVTPLSNDDVRGTTFLTSSLVLSGSDSSFFVSNGDGTYYLDTSTPGTYVVDYYLSASIPGISSCVLSSNIARMIVEVIPTFLYYNAETSSVFQVSNCGPGGTGSFVTYAVPFGTFSSSISQAIVDTQASASIAANGQAFADVNGICTYYSAPYSASFQKNDCDFSGTGSFVEYSVPAGAFTSSISQTDANTLASSSVAYFGQSVANDTGSCLYYNTTISGSFIKNDCGQYGTGSLVVYTISSSIFSSSVSQEDAQVSASNFLNSNGQSYANTNGSCTFDSVNIIWTNTQTTGTDYTDSNLRITVYSPYTNPSGSIVVDEAFNDSGSFNALVGDRIVSLAYVIDPWPLTGSANMYLSVIGQSGSFQVTSNSGSNLTTDIVLFNTSSVQIDAYTTYSPSTSSATINSGSFFRTSGSNICNDLYGSTNSTYYWSGSLDSRPIIYNNLTMTLPVTGMNYIAFNNSSSITNANCGSTPCDKPYWSIDPTTGRLDTFDPIGDLDSANCTNSNRLSLRLSQNIEDVCSSLFTIVYVDSVYTDIGLLVQVFFDASLTVPVIGYNYIVSEGGIVYTINSDTGVVSSLTENSC